MTLSMSAMAQGLSIIRDTEIESVLKKWSEPVLKAANLSPDHVDIILVNSGEINAFVAGGANIFIYAGLLETAEYPEEIIGVIGHEVGHIAGGHLIATRQAMEHASFQSILASVLGIGAAIATGDGRAAGAISAGGAGAATSGFLSHSRLQESAADQAGLSYLEQANINPAGLVTFLEKLEGQELLPASQQSEYMRTHPLTRDRIDTMRIGAKKISAYGPLGQSDKQFDFDMIKAKLMAFRSPQNVPRYYDGNSDNPIDIYANAIMAYQQKNFDQSIALLDNLITKSPNNPYFFELKGQVMRDSGDLSAAEKFYSKSLDLLTMDAPLIQTDLAHVLIEQRHDMDKAESLLLSVIQNDNPDSRAYRLMATLKGRQGQEADAQYYLAEEAIAQGRTKDAERFVMMALNNENLSGDLKIKANDLKLYLNRLPDRDK